MLQQCTRHTFASMGGARSHRLDFAVDGSELFQGATTQQLALRPGSPECNVRLLQGGEIKRMHALRRRKLMHVVKVLCQECADFGARKVIDSYLHDRSGLARGPNAPAAKVATPGELHACFHGMKRAQAYSRPHCPIDSSDTS